VSRSEGLGKGEKVREEAEEVSGQGNGLHL